MGSEHIKQLQFDQYRLGLFLAGIAYSVFGLVTEIFVKVSSDSFFKRLPLSLFAMAIWYLSTRSSFVRQHIRILTMSICVLASIQYFGFFVESNYHFYFSVGLGVVNLTIFTVLLNATDISIFILLSILFNFPYLREMNNIFLIVYGLTISLGFLSYLTVTRLRDKLFYEMEEREVKLKRLNDISTQAAHDIRSPLQALASISQTLDKNSPGFNIMVASVDRIQQIAENLVSQYRKEFSRPIDDIKIDLYSLLIQIIEEKKTVSKDTEFGTPKAHGALLLKKSVSLEVARIFSNILQNSIEALIKSPTKRIDITIIQNSDYIQISVLDTGAGVPVEHQDRIFERGVSLNKSSGTGLGLSRAKEYLESIGGKIDLKSKVGKGTLVILQIPIS